MTDFYHEVQRVARKEHPCSCYASGRKNGRRIHRSHKIRKGQRYVHIAQVFDGDFSTSKLCLIHAAMIQALFATGDYTDGIDYQYTREDWDEYLIGGEGGRARWLSCLSLIRHEMRKLRAKR